MLAELSRVAGVEVREDRLTRHLYSTDGSIYEIEPLGVAFPRSEEDVVAIVRWAAERGIPLLPRGAATSLAGQTVGRALILDFTRYMNRILEVDPERRTITVEPGAVCDMVNLRAARHNLRWPPDPSTSNRATVGGMIGNNSSGARSIRYGMTADCVDSLRIVLADGHVIETRPLALDGPELAAILGRYDREAALYEEILAVRREYDAEIRARFPNVPRNNGGYNLRDVVRDGVVDLARLICGSEGTLGIVTRATLRLEPLPARRALAVLAFDDLVRAMEAVEPLRAHPVSAIELIDRTILELARQTPYRDVAESFPAATRAVLAVEVEGDDAAEVSERVRQVAAQARAELGALRAETLLDAASQRRLWAMRKAAVPIMFRMPGDPKPVPFIEDMAVAPAVLPDYVRGLEELFKRYEVQSVIYAHASVGCLHIRPVLNLKSAEDVEKMARLAADACRLVMSLGGAMSGEHGDGLSRSQWVRVTYGERLWQAFRRIKNAFDPQGILNPGKITAEDVDLRRHLRYADGYRTAEWRSVLDFTPQGSFQQAVELCNGCGACRKATGTMCPTFQALNEEIMTTRGRANLIRAALGGRLDPETLFTPEFKQQVLDYCIGCKGCRSECPSGVDMAKIKAEVLYHFNQRHGVSLRQRLLADVRTLYRLGSLAAPLSNWLAAWPPARALVEGLVGIDRRRHLPRFSRHTLAGWMRRRGLTPPPPGHAVLAAGGGAGSAAGRGGGSGRRVLIFADCFNNYSHPEIGRAAVRLLELAGVEVRLAPTSACCGRPAFSEGLLGQARALARRHVQVLRPYLEAGWELVAIEPSCTSIFRHELRELLGFHDGGGRLLAEHTWDVAEYLARLLDEGALDGLQSHAAQAAAAAGGVDRITFHAHCHQKSLGAHGPTARLLEALTGLPVDVLDAGCCGMAGSFGYKREHYDLSGRIAGNVRRAVERSGGLLVTSGTSCATQLADLYGWHPVHPVVLLAERLHVADR